MNSNKKDVNKLLVSEQGKTCSRGLNLMKFKFIKIIGKCWFTNSLKNKDLAVN